MAGPLRPYPPPPSLIAVGFFFPVPIVPKKVLFSLMARPLREKLCFCSFPKENHLFFYECLPFVHTLTICMHKITIKFLSREISYFERFRGFFYVLFDTSVKKSEKPREIKNYRRKNFSASTNNSVIVCFTYT